MNPLRDIRPWHWLTILSLDAPLVSLVWQDCLARVFQVELFAIHRLALGLAVWLAYVADRWLDGRQLPAGGAVTARHEFARRFARPIAVAWVLVLVGTILLSLAGLARREFLAGLVLAAAVAGYLAACHRRELMKRMGWLKEFAVAGLISGGSVLFVFVRSSVLVPSLWLAAGCLFFLCLLNCAAVSVWERDIDRRQAQPSLAGRFALHSRQLRDLALPLLAVLIAGAVFAGEPSLRRVSLAGIVTTVGALGLIEFGGTIEPDSRRLLADATLLSPLLLLPFY